MAQTAQATQTTQIRDLGPIPQYPHPFHTPETWAAYQASLPPEAIKTTYLADIAQRFRLNQSAGYYLVAPFCLNIPDTVYTQSEARQDGREARSRHLRDLRKDKLAGLTKKVLGYRYSR